MYKKNAQTCLNSKIRACLQRLIVLRTIKLASSHYFYTGRCEQLQVGGQRGREIL